MRTHHLLMVTLSCAGAAGMMMHGPHCPLSRTLCDSHSSRVGKSSPVMASFSEYMSHRSGKDAAQVTTDDAISTLREANTEVLFLLDDLRERRFFRQFAVDLLNGGCAYLSEEDEPCGLHSCEVEEATEVLDELIHRDKSESSFELDSWARWDLPSDFTEYYDLVENPESNTNYNGSNVWRFIHNTIAFQTGVDELGNEWKSDFNRAVSGLHSSVHCHIIEDIERTDPELALSEYQRRLRDEPNAIANLHFAYTFTLGAIASLRTQLEREVNLGKSVDALPVMQQLLASPLLSSAAVQRATEKLVAHIQAPGASTIALRMRTRDLFGVMNCVLCNQCRLHGKVSTLGLATALRALLGATGGDDDGRPAGELRRVELAALITFCAKLSAAVRLVERFEILDAGGAVSNANEAEHAEPVASSAAVAPPEALTPTPAQAPSEAAPQTAAAAAANLSAKINEEDLDVNPSAAPAPAVKRNARRTVPALIPKKATSGARAMIR